MKKTVVAILAIYYLTVTCGVTVNLHYCMKRLASVDWFGSKADKCGRCGMDMHKSSKCCHDEFKVVKLNEDHLKSPVAEFVFSADQPVVLAHSFFITSFLFNTDIENHYDQHPPPLLSAQDSYLQHNVFRI
ncbi:MAG: hypothetical protein J0L56_10720 [Chitinophagales bacterium]|nr:hypothetical protein [Chitinophagales bacterium]